MRLSKAVYVGLGLVGLLAAVLVLAPASHGQTVRGPEDRLPGFALAIAGLQGGGSEIGVSVRDLDDADVERKQLASPEGVVIEDVRGQSPAAEAGLEVGDVLITFDGERVRSARQLARLVQETRSGRTVRAVVMREGARLELEVTPHTRSGPSIAGDCWLTPVFASTYPRSTCPASISTRGLYALCAPGDLACEWRRSAHNSPSISRSRRVSS